MVPYHGFIFSLNVDKDVSSPIPVGTKFHNCGTIEAHGKMLPLGPFLLRFFSVYYFLEIVLGYNLFGNLETYQLGREILKIVNYFHENINIF